VFSLELRGAIGSTKAKNAACPTGVRRNPVSEVIDVSVDDGPATGFGVIHRNGVKAENAGVGARGFFDGSLRGWGLLD
jgi:hypothetical protein